MFEAFSQIAFLVNSGLSPFNSSGQFFHSLRTTKVPFLQILCVNFSMQTKMTVMRNDSADDLARLDVANLHCDNILTTDLKKMDCRYSNYEKRDIILI
jgi:hypothetical protein